MNGMILKFNFLRYLNSYIYSVYINYINVTLYIATQPLTEIYKLTSHKKCFSRIISKVITDRYLYCEHVNHHVYVSKYIHRVFYRLNSLQRELTKLRTPDFS